MNNRILILPGDPEFNFTLGTTFPPGWKNQVSNDEFAFVMGVDGVLRVAAGRQEIDEYIYGGEWDEVDVAES